MLDPWAKHLTPGCSNVITPVNSLEVALDKHFCKTTMNCTKGRLIFSGERDFTVCGQRLTKHARHQVSKVRIEEQSGQGNCAFITMSFHKCGRNPKSFVMISCTLFITQEQIPNAEGTAWLSVHDIQMISLCPTLNLSKMKHYEPYSLSLKSISGPMINGSWPFLVKVEWQQVSVWHRD